MDNDLTITRKADDEFFDLLESRGFKDSPPETILQFLQKKVMLVPFSFYLKRLIYTKAGFTQGVDNVDFEEYRGFLIDAFRANGVRPSLKSASTKLSSVAKNWLNAATVSRETVFLIGFALKLTSGEVSDLLVKGLHESKIYYRNSFEAICSYCFYNGLPFSKMLELNEKYKQCSYTVTLAAAGNSTTNIATLVKNAVNDDVILRIIHDYELDPSNMFSRTAKQEFNALYAECGRIIAERKKFEDDDWDISAIAYKGKITDVIRRKIKGGPEITSSDIEKALNTGTPVDMNGNLIKFSDSVLCDSFRQKRLTRSHINNIINDREAVDRSDLLTMKFFINSYRDSDKSNNERWFSFIEECDNILKNCSMGQIYNANPYDVFLQMCMLTDVPMATYDDILEMSYD